MSAGFSYQGTVHWGTNGAVELALDVTIAVARERGWADTGLGVFLREFREAFFMGAVVGLDEVIATVPARARFAEILREATVRLVGEGSELTEYGKDWARAALGALAAAVSAPRRDGATGVAYLAITGPGHLGGSAPPGRVALLRHGRNFIGRQSGASQHDWPERPVVEAAQWFIECHADGTARVADASSTNGSQLVTGGAVTLVHPALNGGELAWVALGEGAVLRGPYASLAFGWL